MALLPAPQPTASVEIHESRSQIPFGMSQVLPVHSPLLRQSRLLAVPPLSDMLKFGGSFSVSQVTFLEPLLEGPLPQTHTAPGCVRAGAGPWSPACRFATLVFLPLPNLVAPGDWPRAQGCTETPRLPRRPRCQGWVHLGAIMGPPRREPCSNTQVCVVILCLPFTGEQQTKFQAAGLTQSRKHRGHGFEHRLPGPDDWSTATAGPGPQTGPRASAKRWGPCYPTSRASQERQAPRFVGTPIQFLPPAGSPAGCGWGRRGAWCWPPIDNSSGAGGSPHPPLTSDCVGSSTWLTTLRHRQHRANPLLASCVESCSSLRITGLCISPVISEAAPSFLTAWAKTSTMTGMACLLL